MSEESKSDFGKLFAGLAEALEKTKLHKFMGMGKNDMEFPMKVSGIRITQLNRQKGPFEMVAIRPCAKEHEDKTFLGYHLGDLPVEMMASWDPDTQQMKVFPHCNPAIFVPDLGKIVFGCELWWGPIEDENHLRKITDNDIESVWYVRALKQMGEREEAKEGD